MFDNTFEATIVSVTPKCVFDKDDTPRRITEVVLGTEFDDNLAAGLGEVGKDTLKYLKSRDTKDGLILLDAATAKGAFEVGGKKHKCDVVCSKAKAAAPAKEDNSPTIRIHFSFATNANDLLFFVDGIAQPARVKLQRVQQQIPGTD